MMETLLRQILFQTTPLELVLRRVTYTIESAVQGARPGGGFLAPATPCCPVEPAAAAFLRLVVDHRVTGGTRVTWELADGFAEPGPYHVQLQASPSGVPDSDDWVDVGPPAVDPVYLVDDRQRTWGVGEVLHYRVVLVTAADATHVSRPARPSPLLDQRDWLIAQEIARKEQLRLATATGANGYLLKARRYGIRCRCVNPSTRERTNSHCPLCYGVGFVGGYHPPIPCFLADHNPHTERQHTSYAEGRGTVGDVIFKARVAPGLPVVQEDVWVGVGDDARYQVHEVEVVAKHRGVPIVLAAGFRRLPRTDIAYHVPIDPSTGPGCEWGANGPDTDGDGVPDADEPVAVCMPIPGAC